MTARNFAGCCKMPAAPCNAIWSEWTETRTDRRVRESFELKFARAFGGRPFATGAARPRGWAAPLHQPQRVYIHDHIGSRDFLLLCFGEHGTQYSVQFVAAGRFQNKMVAVIALQAFDGSCGGAEHAHAFVASFLEPAAER